MSSSKLVAIVWLILVGVPAEAGYHFSISASSTDPFQNTSAPTNSVRDLYLWLTCSDEGLSSFEADVTASLSVFGFNPLGGVMNIGNPTHLLLAVPGCPGGEGVNRLLGYWVVWDAGGHICLSPSAATGQITAVNCEASPTATTDPYVFGFTSDGQSVCPVGTNGCTGAPPPRSDTFLYEMLADVRTGRRFEGAKCSIEYDGPPTVVDQTAAWCGIDNNKKDLAYKRWVQAGWVTTPPGISYMYAEWQHNNEHDWAFWAPVLPNLEYRVELEFSLFQGFLYRAYAGAQELTQGEPLLDEYFNNVKLCAAKFGAEMHADGDHVPGIVLNHVVFSGCSVKVKGEGWDTTPEFGDVPEEIYDTHPFGEVLKVGATGLEVWDTRP